MNAAGIEFERRGALGLVTLARPEALNALTHGMCLALHGQLRAWAGDPAIGRVAIRTLHERAFCVGGDVLALTRSAREGTRLWRDFFRDEYRLDTAIREYPKPYLAFIDGMVMGGGAGISLHGGVRIGSERTLFAMPETAIGLIPDVGIGHVLARLPQGIGLYLGLTGYRLKAADCLALGLLTHYVPHAEQAALIEALAREGDEASLDRLLGAAARDAGPAPLVPLLPRIGSIFGSGDLHSIRAALAATDEPWAIAAREALAKASPTALLLTAAHVARAKALDFRASIAEEFRLVSRLMAGHDFHEGVRALLIDKDAKPVWRPGRIEDVAPAEIERHFAPLGTDELTFEDH